MTVQTHSTPDVSSTPRNASGPRSIAPPVADEQRDLELVAGVARGEREAIRALATRMAQRVERVARALMGGSLDARDAALQALIELLRNHGSYRGKLRLERWGDRVAAVSVMRFAHAVSRRNADDTIELPDVENTTAARTFEQYLGMLSEQGRQLLLLRHALGFGIPELADVMQCSPQAVRERLQDARREFRGLIRRRESHPPMLASSPGVGVGGLRWCMLRDREALGEPLLPEEHEELALLEAKEPEVWAYVAQVRALELFFDVRGETRAPIDGTLIDGAVEALEVSSATLKTRALVDVAAHDTRAEREPSNWVGVIAWATSAALAGASALALYYYQPDPEAVQAALARDPAPVVKPPDPIPPKPIVVSLPSARTASRGAPLRRGDKLLGAASVLGQGDTVEVAERAGCLEIEPAFEVCLAPHSALTLTKLQADARALTLERGRLVARRQDADAGGTLRVVAEAFLARTEHGAFAFERAGELARVRALRAGVVVEGVVDGVPARRELAEGEGAQLHLPERSLVVAPVPPSQLQRDWDVLATGLHQGATQAARAARSHSTPKLEPQADGVPVDEVQAEP